MENKNNNNQNGYGNGFVLGLLVGVGITLLFTTKRGREIFKILVDRGLDKFSEMQDTIESSEVELEEEESDYVKPESRPAPQEPKKEVKYLAKEPEAKVEEVKKEPVPVEKAPEEKPATNGVPKKTHPVRKFFRLKKS